jgi:hypothetical protein
VAGGKRSSLRLFPAPEVAPKRAKSAGGSGSPSPPNKNRYRREPLFRHEGCIQNQVIKVPKERHPSVLDRRLWVVVRRAAK